MPVALMHPFSGKFITATPNAYAPLQSTAVKIRDWELFDLRPIPSDTIPKGVFERLTRAERLLAAPLTVEHLTALLSQAEDFADMVNAAIPLMATADLDAVAKAILSDDRLRHLLSAAFPADPWATDAVPKLAEWILQQTPPPPAPRPIDQVVKRSSLFLRSRKQRPFTPEPVVLPPPPSSRLLEIGPELDRLGTTSLTGAFSSFPQACAIRARRTVMPKKKIALVATARNEGIYILEWIAYHRLLGVEAFYIYSNDNDDGSDELLATLAKAGVITWINNRLDPAVGNAQFKAYGHALS